LVAGRVEMGIANERQVLADGCYGDADGLTSALGTTFEVVFSNCDDQGYGHHSYDEIYKLPDGRVIHAECGGYSCKGSGSWSYCADETEAMKLVPEWRRPS
jgi:hypothetical protein